MIIYMHITIKDGLTDTVITHEDRPPFLYRRPCSESIIYGTFDSTEEASFPIDNIVTRDYALISYKRVSEFAIYADYREV